MPAASRCSVQHLSTAASGAFSDMCSALKPPASSEQLSALGWCCVLRGSVQAATIQMRHPSVLAVISSAAQYELPRCELILFDCKRQPNSIDRFEPAASVYVTLQRCRIGHSLNRSHA